VPVILSKNIRQNISIAVWQIAETEEFFYHSLLLLPEDESKIRNIKLQKVRFQKLACRAALAQLLGDNKVEITYSETGQPLLKNYYISFSHTTTSSAVALSTVPVGIDMEELTPRILKLYPRFMSEKEIFNSDVTELKNLYYFWCAKEAMYKWYSMRNLDFIEDLYVLKNEKKGSIKNKHTLQLKDFCVDNKYIVVSY